MLFIYIYIYKNRFLFFVHFAWDEIREKCVIITTTIIITIINIIIYNKYNNIIIKPSINLKVSPKHSYRNVF